VPHFVDTLFFLSPSPWLRSFKVRPPFRLFVAVALSTFFFTFPRPLVSRESNFYGKRFGANLQLPLHILQLGSLGISSGGAAGTLGLSSSLCFLTHVCFRHQVPVGGAPRLLRRAAPPFLVTLTLHALAFHVLPFFFHGSGCPASSLCLELVTFPSRSAFDICLPPPISLIYGQPPIGIQISISFDRQPLLDPTSSCRLLDFVLEFPLFNDSPQLQKLRFLCRFSYKSLWRTRRHPGKFLPPNLRGSLYDSLPFEVPIDLVSPIP